MKYCVEWWVGNDGGVEGGFGGDVLDDYVGELGGWDLRVVFEDGLPFFVGADGEDYAVVVAEEGIDAVRGDEA